MPRGPSFEDQFWVIYGEQHKMIDDDTRDGDDDSELPGDDDNVLLCDSLSSASSDGTWSHDSHSADECEQEQEQEHGSGAGSPRHEDESDDSE